MRCEGCGLTAQALKTVRWRNGNRRKFTLCDSCWLPISDSLWIVRGPVCVTSRCDGCGKYLNPRELVPETSRPGGGYKRDLVSTGLCPGCAGGQTCENKGGGNHG